MKYYLIAGEASGDLHAGNLMKELKAQDPEAVFRFIGGEQMQSASGMMVKHYKDLAYMGFIPVLLHLPTILRNMKLCKQDIATWKPDVVILVDYPGFNLDIAKFVHKKGVCPVFYYISPKIWAWKEYRIKRIRRDVDELFSILPFEVDWFAQRNYPIHYVGNPCVDAVEKMRKTFKDFSELRTIAILPGSRRQEIKDNLGMMLQAASKFKAYNLVIAGAPNIEAEYYRRHIPKGIIAHVRFGQTYQILNQSVAALVTSGTATLETAILRVPQVVCYYTPVGKFISFLRKRIIKVPYISLVNLIANKEIVQELVADRMTVENIENSLADILPNSKGRKQMLEEYDRMNKILGGTGASKRAATKMIECLKNRKP
ncbi:MAG: lipid-A-disaccharide synthase [Bacteroidaceae bacterium]|nr:lipid-A-disaccharide synthase [Bacteroidaceae bacterium]